MVKSFTLWVNPQFVAFALLVALVQSAGATMIVVIYTKDGFWLASDSYRSAGGQHAANVCKIHETPLGLLAKSGESQAVTESGEIYSTDKEIEDLLLVSPDLTSFESRLRIQFKQDIERELAFLVDDPEVTAQNLEQFKMAEPIPKPLIPMLSRTIIMFDTKTSDSVGKVLLVQPQSDEKKELSGTYYMFCAPSNLGWHAANDVIQQASQPHTVISFPPSVHEFTYLGSYTKTDAWVQKHPKQAMKEILQQAHREDPDDVGPPYAMVHVISRKSNVSKIKWVSKGVCPGWTENVYKEKTLVQIREEMRKQQPSNP